MQRGLAVEDREVVDGKGEAVGVAVAGAVGKEEVGVGVGEAGDPVGEGEGQVAGGVEVEGDTKAEAGVADHAGEGKVGGPVAGGGDAPPDGELDAVGAEELEGAEPRRDGLGVVHGVAVGDRVER